MSVELILFVSLILLVIYNFHAFGLLEKNGKKTQPIGSDIKETQKHGNEISAKTDDQTSSDKSGDSKEQNNMTDCMDTAHDEYTDNESSCCGEEIDPAEEQNIFQEFVDENILNEYMAQKGVLRGLMKFIKENIEGWKRRKLNIAIIGNAGTGKSSLINALRGLKPGDDKAAPVGVTETTTEETRYVFPNNENTVLWDLPGVGTERFRREEYLDNVDIHRFDALIIVSASRFTENEIWLAEEILKQKNFIFFVRTKVDIDLMNDKRDHPETFDVDGCLEAMRMDIRNNLDKSNIPVPKAGIFLVSSAEKGSYDFKAMSEKLLNLRGVALKNLLQMYVTEVVKKERDVKKGQFLVEKCVAGLCSLVLLVVLKADVIVTKLSESMYSTCKEEFCLDDQTLKEVTEEINKSVVDLQKNLHFFKKIENDPSYLSMSAFRRRHVPRGEGLTRVLFSGYHSFNTSLHHVCDILAKDELTLTRLRLSRLVEELRPL